jgi:hypothetical protein
MHALNHLEMHVAHACNLACESCSHYSHSHKGMVRRDEALDWMAAWAFMLEPKVFKLLGGEPTLNMELCDILIDARAMWPRAEIHFSTNAFFVHKHPDLGRVLGDIHASVTVSVHSHAPEYREKMDDNLHLLRDWQRIYGFTLWVGDGTTGWSRRHHGKPGAIMPFTEGNPRASWQACSAKHYPQLYDGKLWKCAPMAYLNLTPNLDPAWNPYRQYQPLSPDCTEDELAAWLKREEEPTCAMCPTRLEPFPKPMPFKQFTR